MPINKDCADYLRAYYHSLTGGKLSAGHAHELVAAFFGYASGAALRAEVKYPLAGLSQAEILMPDLSMMDRRLQDLKGVPANMPAADDIATQLCTFLSAQGYFGGDVWQTRDLSEFIIVDFIHKDPQMIEEALASEVALTNAYFDELYVDEVMLNVGLDALVATATGSLFGENDPDRVFHGDKVNFQTQITFPRIAARIAFGSPEVETGGAIDTSYYDENA